MMQHEEIKDLLAAYALGSVPEDDRRVVADHIVTCADCRAELADYEAVSESLALAVPPVDVPSDFTERVVGAAVGERSEAEPGKLKRRWTRLGILAGAALVVTVIAVAGTIIESNNDSQRRQEVLALLASSDGITLTGEDDVIGKVAGSRFALAGLDEAPEGKTYQLWLMKGDRCPSAEPAACELVSAGTFDTEDGVALIELDESAQDWQDAAVTIEDDDGAEFPTSTPFVHSL